MIVLDMSPQLSRYQTAGTTKPIYSHLVGCSFRLLRHSSRGFPRIRMAVRLPIPTLINHSRQADLEVHINAFIQKQCSLGAMLGLFDTARFKPWCQVSAPNDLPEKTRRLSSL